MTKIKWDFRDVSAGLQMFRDFLLGRKHNLHGRFPPLISPRTIPTPDIPRGREYKYSNQYYCMRSAADSVKPPVVAPVAEGPPIKHDPKTKTQTGGMRADTVSLVFAGAPTPGMPWWWDGHCYYEIMPETPSQPPPCQPTPYPPSQPECKVNSE